ncbi:hypothetical protein PAAG_11427 [Paracoccidioides lutzii Pb01]|uniref:Uncharacterized protein n=1 Tax=Paracoccidioides lutzii (strain ATCC MYA-826 / Pb01) TaxID=502779 RepID=A0A0A2V228_PARBA|nr:hypothetical protein PAAG_11427 [Paracoccidioides lutzii Pb01]KGQ01851.1 hypothetical protein PAAG_11427 [Paracoccidioides lutzii Pb01]
MAGVIARFFGARPPVSPHCSPIWPTAISSFDSGHVLVELEYLSLRSPLSESERDFELSPFETVVAVAARRGEIFRMRPEPSAVQWELFSGFMCVTVDMNFQSREVG